MDKHIVKIFICQTNRANFIKILNKIIQVNIIEETLPKKKILVSYKGRKTCSRKFYVQKYDKELFIPKHPMYSPQRPTTLSTLKKTTLK